MNKIPEIINVDIVSNDIVLTIMPAIEIGDSLLILEVGTSKGIGLLQTPGNKIRIPFSGLSHVPVEEYNIAYIKSSGEILVEKIENEDFHAALKFKTTLYDIENINSSHDSIIGRSNPGTLVKLKSYDFLYQPSNIVAKTYTSNENIFKLENSNKFFPYKPYVIEAEGIFHSPTEHIVVDKATSDSELIANDSFQYGLRDWQRHPENEDDTNFTQKEGYGNFKLTGDLGALEAAQYVLGPSSSRFKMSCEIRVHSFNDLPNHTVFLGSLFISGAPGQFYTAYDVSQSEIGVWIKLELEAPFQPHSFFNKYGFTSVGIGEMDVRNVSMIEI